MNVDPLKIHHRVLDVLLHPIMFFIGGCHIDSIQETHPWHCQKVYPNEINKKIGVTVESNDESTLTNKRSPLPFFHIPILGGWKNYVVLEVDNKEIPWHIGWIHLHYSTEFTPRHSLHRLKIFQKNIRMLTMSKGHKTLFFAISQNGNQIPLRKTGEGILGDKKYLNVRLF